MYGRVEVIPRRVLGPFGVPALGWLVLRASRRELEDWQMELLETDALGVGRSRAGRDYGQTESGMNHRSSRVIAALSASHSSHAVRIAREANLLDTPLDMSPVSNPGTLLTDEQYTALDLTTGGLTPEQAGILMGDRSPGAIRQLLSRAYRNLGARSNSQAAIIAYEINLFQPLTAAQLQPYEKYFQLT